MDQKLLDSITENTAQIQERRKALHEAREKSIEAKEKLKIQECASILKGIPGKNKEDREAYLYADTSELRDILQDNEKSERIAALNLELSLDARRSLENIVKLTEAENGL